MGRKCTGSWQYLYLCIALLICTVISGCASFGDNVENGTIQRNEPRCRLLNGDEAQEDQNLHASANMPTTAEVLFNTGLSYADPRDPRKDHNRSVTTFKRLIKEYPNSVWADRSHTLLDVLQENARLRKQSTDNQQENARLKQIIEQSKNVDIEIEQKKRESIK